MGRCCAGVVVVASSTGPVPLQPLSGTQDVSLVMVAHQKIVLHTQNSQVFITQVTSTRTQVFTTLRMTKASRFVLSVFGIFNL